MRKNKIVTGFILMLTVCICITGCNFPTIGIGDIPDPKDTVTVFFDSVCKGDFERADTCLGGSSISMDSQDSSAFALKLLEYLQQSYSYKTVGEAKIDGLNSNQQVEFTYLDFNLLLDDLRSKSTELGKNYMVTHDETHTVVEGGVCSLTDEGAELVAIESLDYIMTSPEKYYTTKNFRIEMKYSQKSWHILINDELFEAIVGKYNVTE